MCKQNYLKISIIIPAHNAEKTIERCVRSIYEQKYEYLECIIVENNSADKTYEICIKLEKKYKFLNVYKSDKNGVSEARNLALRKITGDVIGFCDADDYLEKGAIKSIVEEFKKNKEIGCVIGAFYIQDNAGNKSYRGLKRKIVSSQKIMLHTIADDRVMGSVWNKYYRVSELTNIYFDTSLEYCEDMHFNILAMSGMKNVGFLITDIPLYCYVDNTSSVTHQTNNLFNKENELKYITAMKKILSDCRLNKKVANQVKMKIACLAVDTLENTDINRIQKINVKNDLKENFIYLLVNCYKYNFRWNIKRILKAVKFIIEN